MILMVLDDTVELLNQINLEILLATKHFSYGSLDILSESWAFCICDSKALTNKLCKLKEHMQKILYIFYGYIHMGVKVPSRD